MENLKKQLIDWNSEYIDEHRRGISDIKWANKQPRADEQPWAESKYIEGDVVEFMVGGYGIINKVSLSQSGGPTQYATNPIKNKKFHAKGKYAWHYEGDIKKLIEESAIRKFDT